MQVSKRNFIDSIYSNERMNKNMYRFVNVQTTHRIYRLLRTAYSSVPMTQQRLETGFPSDWNEELSLLALLVLPLQFIPPFN